MKYLVTGAAGFIGFHLAERLLQNGHDVVGIDNINDYYDVRLKYGRLAESGIGKGAESWHTPVKSDKWGSYTFIRMALEDKDELLELFGERRFDVVINLAAQAGVRYSLENPDAYVQSNVVGFLNILEACRRFPVKHLVYASSSSVYGLNREMPFSTDQKVDSPVSLYAATKKANELMAHAYSHLYGIPTTGLRFFTVYGPWGRPDMAYYLFADAIVSDRPIKVFNQGKMKRDFTYIDDVVKGIISVADTPPVQNLPGGNEQPEENENTAYRVFNIGNNKPVDLIEFIGEIERNLKRRARMEMLDMQAGDVVATWADIGGLVSKFNYSPSTSVKEGVESFVKWFLEFKKADLESKAVRS